MGPKFSAKSGRISHSETTKIKNSSIKMEKEKENLSPNDEIIPSSQGSLTFNEPNTQRLCLELEDETEKLVPGTLVYDYFN